MPHYLFNHCISLPFSRLSGVFVRQRGLYRECISDSDKYIVKALRHQQQQKNPGTSTFLMSTDRSVKIMIKSACHRLVSSRTREGQTGRLTYCESHRKPVALQESAQSRTKYLIVQHTFTITLPLYHRAHENFDRANVFQRDFALCGMMHQSIVGIRSRVQQGSLTLPVVWYSPR